MLGVGYGTSVLFITIVREYNLINNKVLPKLKRDWNPRTDIQELQNLYYEIYKQLVPLLDEVMFKNLTLTNEGRKLKEIGNYEVFSQQNLEMLDQLLEKISDNDDRDEFKYLFKDFLSNIINGNYKTFGQFENAMHGLLRVSYQTIMFLL